MDCLINFRNCKKQDVSMILGRKFNAGKDDLVCVQLQTLHIGPAFRLESLRRYTSVVDFCCRCYRCLCRFFAADDNTVPRVSMECDRSSKQHGSPERQNKI